MNFQQFINSLERPTLPDDISDNLKALWFDARGSWNKAHDIVQENGGFEGDRIHAYLHRKEGDLPNASYWYSKVGMQLPCSSLEEEWSELVQFMLSLK